jgi:hypothetical protein
MTPENLTLLFSILSSGGYTVVLYATRRSWLPVLAHHPLRNALLLGVLNAAVVETIFLTFEHLFGAQGIAAHPNLILDLLVTMPWYALMLHTYIHVYHRQRFSSATVLLLGAVYEFGADGIVGQIIGIPFGDSQFFDPGYWILLVLIAFWQFIPVYSSLVLPPTWVIESTPPPPKPLPPAWRDALRPLFWLLPYTGVVMLLILLLSTLSLV